MTPPRELVDPAAGRAESPGAVAGSRGPAARPTRVLHSVRVRILAAAATGGFLCALLVIVSTLATVHASFVWELADLEGTVSQDGLAECQAGAARWVMHHGLLTVWAYDETGRSHNPNAPALPEGATALPLGATRMLPDHPLAPLWDRSSLQRVSQEGPCALLFGVTQVDLPHRPGVQWANIAAVGIGLGLVLVLTMGLAVQPLLRKLRRLDRAASRVGSEDFLPIDDPGDDELGRISRTLDAAHHRIVSDKVELQRRHQALEAHLASLAHDLRTPLASLQLTLEEIAATLPGAGVAIGDARLEVAYLEALADNLHQATRLRSGLRAHAAGARADLGEIVRRVAVRFTILGRARRVAVEHAQPDQPVWIGCDPALAERALANLVHNALVHGASDSAVGIALDALGRRFVMTVSNQGPEVSSPQAQRLSSRRLDDLDRSRTRAQDGLGVAIANEVAELAGWQIAYQPLPEGGLQVTVSGETLPAEPA